MHKAARHRLILERIKLDHRIYITTFCEELGISDDTLRRDLNELDEQGLLTKVHGGAVARSGIPVAFSRRFNTGVAAKQEMAAKVVPLFRSGDTILIDGGTSNLELARQLPPEKKLTVFTNSFPIINELINRENIAFVFLGGDVFPSSCITVGVSVVEALLQIRPDWLVLGASNIHPQLGLTVSDRNEAAVKRTMLERGKQRIVLADSYKLNSAESYTVGFLRDLDYLVLENDKVDEVRNSWPQSSYTIL